MIVAGAGHNGLVSAAYLAQAGLDVLVLEAAPTIGGMTSTNAIFEEAPEHMVNEGSVQASLFRTTTIDDDLGLAKKYGLRQRVTDPAHVQMQLDHASLGLWRDPQKVADELKHFSRRDAQAYLEIFEVIDAATQVGLPLMQTNPRRPEFQAVMKSMGRAARYRKHLAEIARWAGSTQAETVEEHFESDIIKAALMIGLPFMNYNSDASGWSLIYLGVLSRYGVAMFEGGTGAFPKALAQCIADHRGRIRTSAEVTQLIVRGGRVAGVELDSGEELFARRGVLTAFSPSQTLNRLLPDGVLPKRLANRAEHIPTRGRGFADGKVNVVLKGKIRMTKMEKWRGDGLNLKIPLNSFHTYEETLNAQAAAIRGEVPDHVPGLGYCTTEFDPSLGPKDKETWWYLDRPPALRPEDRRGEGARAVREDRDRAVGLLLRGARGARDRAQGADAAGHRGALPRGRRQRLPRGPCDHPVRPRQAGLGIRRLQHPGPGAVPDRIGHASRRRDQRHAGAERRANDAEAVQA